MGNEEVARGEFELDGYDCEYNISYLNVQEKYWLDGKISDESTERAVSFSETKEEEYSESEIKNVFEKELRFMNAISGSLEEILDGIESGEIDDYWQGIIYVKT
jgi:hypothetical protein